LAVSFDFAIAAINWRIVVKNIQGILAEVEARFTGYGLFFLVFLADFELEISAFQVLIKSFVTFQFSLLLSKCDIITMKVFVRPLCGALFYVQIVINTHHSFQVKPYFFQQGYISHCEISFSMAFIGTILRFSPMAIVGISPVLANL